MSEEATRLLEWRGTDGTLRSLITVIDHEKDPSDIDYRRFEICFYDSSGDKWKTDEELDYIDEITDFGIPESLID